MSFSPITRLASRELFRLIAGIQYRDFERQTHSPQDSFSKLWEKTYQTICHSKYWQTKGLHQRLEENPTTTYETYREFLEDHFSDTTSPLNGEPLKHWALSSGSSGPPKRFPITDSYRKHASAIHLQTMYSYWQRFPRLFREPIFYLAAFGPLGKSPSGVEISYISNYNYRHLPSFVRRLYGTPVEILKDEKTLLQWRALYAMAGDCSAIFSVTPSVIVSLLHQIRDRGLEFLPYLRNTRAVPNGLAPLKVSKERLQQIERAGVGSSSVDYAELWPGLSFVGCWTDAVCRLQASELRKLLGNKVSVVETPFSSTEAWVSVPLSNEYSGGAIHPGSVLVEFLEVGETQLDQMKKPWELEVGKHYELYVTTAMGLVRYRMYDIVRCTRYFNEVAEISFVRKSSQELSLGLVCLSETELLQALESVQELRNRPVFFCPSRNGRGLSLFVNSRELVTQSLSEKLHTQLCQISPMYLEEFQLGTIDRVAVEELPYENPQWRLRHSQSKPYLIRHQRPD